MKTAAAALPVILVVAAAAGCATRAQSDPQFLTPYGVPSAPYSPAVVVGDLIFLSGQIGTDSAGRLVPGGIIPETRQTLDRIKDLVERAGSSMDRVVKCTVMLADIAEWPAMNSVYVTYFPGSKPARSALGGTDLVLGARVEIECIASRGNLNGDRR